MESSSVSTIKLQQRASNPDISCWVNASAGSGKTKVLIDRIIRLLLRNTSPERILCLTFSRAAAGEMQQRLMLTLESLQKISQIELENFLSNLGEPLSPSNMNRIKSLSSIIQAQPVAIQTVHSFCQTLLQQHLSGSILEPSPRIMENFEEHTYLTQAFEYLIEDPTAQNALEEFFTFHGDKILFAYLCNTTRHLHTLSFEEAQNRLSELFDVNAAPQFPHPPLEISPYLKGLLNIAIPNDAIAKDHPFAQCFLTQKCVVRAKILPASIQKQYPEAEVQLKIYAEELGHYYSKMNRFEQVQKSLQFWQLQQIFIAHYKHIKEAHHLWDFHDLIEKTLQILKLDAFDQILMDLNYRLDHILIDEAQDTSVSQWQVIEHLIQGLFSHHTNHRSLFVVGDEKQSIYSFQGADIRMYQDMQKHFATLCHPWEEITLATSFRSGENILKLVDTIFEQNAKGLGENTPKHIAYHKFAGCAEVLPFIEVKTIEIEPWPIFETYPEVYVPEQQLAEQVINHLEKAFAQGVFLESKNRHATWGDVMILMRKRTNLMEELTNLCTKRHIPYSAFDPKNSMECLNVQDLISAVEFILMPQNDLNLAALLKSPWMQSIGKIDEDALFNLCYDRGSFLWDEVQTKYAGHAKALSELLNSTPATTYDYFQYAYDVMDVKCELLDNFMDNVFKRFELLNLNIRELVNHVHTYPPIFIPSPCQEGLQISTVHGAKGLEAPIVVILDNGEEPTIGQDIVLYDPVAQFWFLKPPMAADTILTSALKDHHQQALEFEHNRLFYVALTRAKERLILAGLPHEANTNSWYWRVHDCIV
jgi:ATP-dependent helicase/nuclease subunit A